MAKLSLDMAAIASLPALPSVDAAVQALAQDILQDSQATVPVDTGTLRASGEVTGSGSEYSVSYSADYAAYVEFGTENMNAQPFLRPAALKQRG